MISHRQAPPKYHNYCAKASNYRTGSDMSPRNGYEVAASTATSTTRASLRFPEREIPTSITAAPCLMWFSPSAPGGPQATIRMSVPHTADERGFPVDDPTWKPVLSAGNAERR